MGMQPNSNPTSNLTEKRTETSKVLIGSFYTFTPIAAADLGPLADWIRAECRARGILGLYILGVEGVNATISGEELRTRGWIDTLSERLATKLVVKWTHGPKHPFKKLSIKKKREIVTSWNPRIQPMRSEEKTHLSPSAWDEAMNRNDTVVLDTRNDYESRIGAFEGAIKPPIVDFSQFAAWLKENPIPKEKTVLMYCTGGIRCEKAIVEMKDAGYKNVFQLDGGIISYLAEKPHSKFQGECFVFDNRVAIDQELKPSEKYRFCLQCGDPTENVRGCKDCGKPFGFCQVCLSSSDSLVGRVKHGEHCSVTCATGSRRRRKTTEKR